MILEIVPLGNICIEELDLRQTHSIWNVDPSIQVELKTINLSIDFLHFTIYKRQIDSISYNWIAFINWGWGVTNLHFPKFLWGSLVKLWMNVLIIFVRHYCLISQYVPDIVWY